MGFREERNVKEGFLEEVISQPKGQERITRKGNAVPDKMKSTCKGPEARGGRFIMAGAQKSPEDIIFIELTSYFYKFINNRIFGGIKME